MPPEIPAAPESQRLPSMGDVLAGKYRAEESLGVGGMGAVIAATDLTTGQRVAIKIMLPHLVRQPEFAARFLREARATAALRTEHVARVLDVGRFSNGEPYLVMELLQGQDLDKFGRQRGPLPIEEAVGYVLEACDAIAEAHSIGIIHRDLKPSNLFLARRLSGQPVIKVLDFGISKPTKLDPGEMDTRALTGTDTTLGSPQYMSPEQFRSSKKVDVRTDIWSLGMILHRLLTGRVAFEADSVGELLTMLVTEPPTPLRKRRRDAPAELEEIILRCLEKDPANRIQNIGQLVRLLAPFCPATGYTILPRVVALLGQDAVSRPLPAVSLVPPAPSSTPSVPSAVPEGPTQSNWAPTGPIRTPNNRLRVGLGLCVVAAGILGASLGARRLLRQEPALEATPAKGPIAESTAAPSSAVTSAPVAAAASSAIEASGSGPTVAIQLALEPRDASVEIDGAPATGNPIRLPKDGRTHVLMASAPGYLPESREITSRGDAKLRIALKRQAGARLAGPRAPHSSPSSSAAEPTGRRSKGPMETDL